MAAMKVVWIIGDPGAGKTSIVRALLKEDSWHGTVGSLTQVTQRPKWTVGRYVVAAGHYTGEPFDGADTVPYNGAMDALEFWLDNFNSKSVTILDGDRFSNGAALVFFKTHVPEHQLVCVRVLAETEQLAAQRKARIAITGKEQNATWLKGRSTKVANFFDAFPGEKFTLSNHSTPEAAARVLMQGLEES